MTRCILAALSLLVWTVPACKSADPGGDQFGSGGRDADSGQTNGTGGNCGNDVVDGEEECDGAALDGNSCVSSGYQSGTLSCDGTCMFDFSMCTGPMTGATTG